MSLTPREIEVLGLMAEGMTNQQIAEQLIVSPTTIKTHVQNILQSWASPIDARCLRRPLRADQLGVAPPP